MPEGILLFPAVIIAVLIELRRQKLAKANLSPEASRAALFDYSLTIWLVLILLMLFPELGDPLRILRRLDFGIVALVGLMGLTAALPVFWPGWQSFSRRGQLLFGVGLALLTGGIVFSSTREILIFAVLPGILLPLVWNIHRLGRLGKIAGLLLVAAYLAVSAWEYLYPPVFGTSQHGNWVVQMIGLGNWMSFPLMTGLVMAAALRAALDPDTPRPARLRSAVSLGVIAAGMLAFTLYQLYLEVLWDRATDGFSAQFIVFFCLLGGLAGAMLAAWALPGRRKLAPLALSIALLLLMTQSRDLMMKNNPSAINADWGIRISQAIMRYHARNGRYPAALSDLVPFDIWRIQQPFAFEDENWCYDAGADYYRLGYVDRYPMGNLQGASAVLNMVSSAGKPPAGPWFCEEAVKRKQGFAPQPPG